MTDPYRPPDAPLARNVDAPPMWESFTTWGVALVSICLSLLVWGVVATIVLLEDGPGAGKSLVSVRPLSMLLLFSLPAPAGVALLMKSRFSAFFYAAFALGAFVAAMLIGRGTGLPAIGTCALIFTVWTVVLWSRGRFRRT